MRTTSITRAGLSLLCLATILTAWTPAASADSALLWYASRSAQARTNWLYGDDACAYGDRDCNRCVHDVERKVADALTGGMDRWAAKPLHFNWVTQYDPSGLRPVDVYDAGGLDEFVYHAQGFVRTSHPELAYAVSHSDDEFGSVSLYWQRPDGRRQLAYIHETDSGHPSGIFSIGDYVGYVDGENALDLIDLDAPTAPPASYSMPTDDPEGRGLRTAGGGIAMAKLFGGGHLIATTRGSKEGHVLFYFIDGPIESPNRAEFLGQWTCPSPETNDCWSENLSLITECGSRNIYALHAGGDDDFWTVSTGWWRLSRITWNEDGPQLLELQRRYVAQDQNECWTRGAGTASPRHDGDLHFACIQRAVDGDVDGGDGDAWAFREATF